MAIKNNRKSHKAPKSTIGKSAIDYSKDPFFIKKNERASEVIKKYGIPEHLVKK
jgi:hypothetical protein